MRNYDHLRQLPPRELAEAIVNISEDCCIACPGKGSAVAMRTVKAEYLNGCFQDSFQTALSGKRGGNDNENTWFPGCEH